MYADDIFNHLCGKDIGPYMEFTDFFSVNTKNREAIQSNIDSLIQNKKIDMIICIGTNAGIIGKTASQGRIPVLVSFSVDPVTSGITKDSDVSGIKNIWAHVDFSGSKNQLMLYKSICDFTNLGMIYYSESVAGLKGFQSAAENMGIKISSVKMDEDASSTDDTDNYYSKYISNISTLVNEYKIDAFMINSDMINDEEAADKICNMLYEKGIPVFGQSGDEFIQKGSPLMSVTFDPKDDAVFLAITAEGVLSGSKPEEMPQKYSSPLHIAINKTAADKLNADLNYDILKYADKIYY